MSAHFKETVNKLVDNRHTVILCLSLASVFIIHSSDQYNNYFAQNLFLIIVGLVAWLCLLTIDRASLKKLRNLSLITVLLCCVALLLFSHTYLNSFGNYYSPSGVLTLIAFIGIGLVAASLPRKTIVMAIFVSASLLASLSLIYSFANLHNQLYPGRLSGLMFQPDILAAYLGAGFIAGTALLHERRQKSHTILLIALDSLMLICIILTKTRSVIFGLIIVVLALVLLKYRSVRLCLIITGLVIVSAVLITTSVGIQKVETSLGYRFGLQKVVFTQYENAPLLVAGNVGLDNDLACNNLTKYPQLIETCNKDYIFTSSHNIFLDRFVVLGIMGGLAYLALVIAAIARSLESSKFTDNTIGLIILLIAIYYLTNVTSITLELIVWLCLVNPKLATKFKLV